MQSPARTLLEVDVAWASDGSDAVGAHMSAQDQFSDLVDILAKSAVKHKNANLFGTKIDGVWQWTTYGEFAKQVDAVRGGLAALGVSKGDTVAIISANRVEWAVAAYATYGLGAQFCPMYEHQLDSDRQYILEDSGAKVVITSSYAIYETTRPWTDELPSLEHVLCMALPAEDEASFSALVARGQAKPTPTVEVDPSWTCGFIYTSGTTGKPKGVLLTHNNIVSNINGVSRFFPIDTRDVSLCFLPWAHSFGQTCELHFLITRGAAMAMAESVEKLVDNFSEVKPTILLAVPRIFNRIYDGLIKRMAAEGGLKKTLFDAAMANAVKREELAAEGTSSAIADLKHKVLDKLVFSKVRDRFGGRLRFALSGGAALAPEVAQFIDRLGIFVCEGYGLTETSPIVSSNRPGARKIGSVGQPIPGVEVVIDKTETGPDAPDGEVVVKGPNVMKGYHGRDEETAEVIDADCTFHTGDLGRLDADGYLFITGRIKEQYKLQNGKYVVPGPLEDMLQISGYITQAFIDGSNQPYNGALIVPDKVAIEKWAAAEGISGDYESILGNDKTHALIEAEIQANSDDFKGYERVRKFTLIPEEFTVENGLLTPKMSVKRRLVLDRYKKELEELRGG